MSSNEIRRRTPANRRGRKRHEVYDRIFQVARNLTSDEEYAHKIDEPEDMLKAQMCIRSALIYRLGLCQNRGEFPDLRFSYSIQDRYVIVRRVDRD